MSTTEGDGQDESAIYSEQQLLKLVRVDRRQNRTYQRSNHGRIVPSWGFGDAESHPQPKSYSQPCPDNQRYGQDQDDLAQCNQFLDLLHRSRFVKYHVEWGLSKRSDDITE